MNKHFILMLLLTMTFGCDRVLVPVENNSAPVNFSPGDSVSLAYHQTALYDSENVELRFKDLEADSRCPIEWRCFWQGDADILFTIRNQDSTKDFNLHTAWPNKRDTLILNYNIELLDVQPYRHADVEYRPEQYQVVIAISKEQ